MERADLKRIQQIFIDAEEWEEVSRIQHEIEALPKPEPVASSAFMGIVRLYLLNYLLTKVEGLLYLLERMKEEDPQEFYGD